MLTVSAARRGLPSPVGLPLAGFLRRAQRGLLCEVQDDPLEINAAAFRDADATLRGGAPRTPSSPKIARDSRHNALSGYMGQGSSAWGRFHVGRDRAFASGDLSGAGLALSSVAKAYESESAPQSNTRRAGPALPSHLKLRKSLRRTIEVPLGTGHLNHKSPRQRQAGAQRDSGRTTQVWECSSNALVGLPGFPAGRVRLKCSATDRGFRKGVSPTVATSLEALLCQGQNTRAASGRPFS
jgi:hypothetical protein